MSELLQFQCLNVYSFQVFQRDFFYNRINKIHVFYSHSNDKSQNQYYSYRITDFGAVKVL